MHGYAGRNLVGELKRKQFLRIRARGNNFRDILIVIN